MNSLIDHAPLHFDKHCSFAHRWHHWKPPYVSVLLHILCAITFDKYCSFAHHWHQWKKSYISITIATYILFWETGRTKNLEMFCLYLLSPEINWMSRKHGIRHHDKSAILKRQILQDWCISNGCRTLDKSLWLIEAFYVLKRRNQQKRCLLHDLRPYYSSFIAPSWYYINRVYIDFQPLVGSPL